MFVLASYRFDTQGMVLAEAAAAGTPILYCDDRLTVGVGPDNALLTGHEPGELATGMRALLDAPERLETMSAAVAGTGTGADPGSHAGQLPGRVPEGDRRAVAAAPCSSGLLPSRPLTRPWR